MNAKRHIKETHTVVTCVTLGRWPIFNETKIFMESHSYARPHGSTWGSTVGVCFWPGCIPIWGEGVGQPTGACGHKGAVKLICLPAMSPLPITHVHQSLLRCPLLFTVRHVGLEPSLEQRLCCGCIFRGMLCLEFEMSPLAHVFEQLVPSWWLSLGKLCNL